MDTKGIEIYIKQLNSKDDGERYNAFQEMSRITEEKVDWCWKYIDEFKKKLDDENSYQRSIGIMMLCNLSKNETDGREFRDILPALMKRIDDEKFITERQYIQNIWKVAVENDEYKEKIVGQLKNEYVNCLQKKHYNLIRLDIITSLNLISEKTGDKRLEAAVSELIGQEDDIKNRKKYLYAIESL